MYMYISIYLEEKNGVRCRSCTACRDSPTKETEIDRCVIRMKYPLSFPEGLVNSPIETATTWPNR